MPPRKKNQPVTFDEHLGNVIDMLRVKRRLTVEELAAQSGVNYATLRRRIDGAPMIANELYRLAQVLDVRADRIADEALEDFGGMEKLLREYGAVSDVAANVTVEDNITYLGHVTPPALAAAEDDPRVPGKD